MSKLILFILIIFIPAALVFTLDASIYAQKHNEKLNFELISTLFDEKPEEKRFDFSTIGFMLTKYSPDFYKTVVDSYQDSYAEEMSAFLKFKAFYLCVALGGLLSILATLGYIIALVFKRVKDGKSGSKKFRRDF